MMSIPEQLQVSHQDPLAVDTSTQALAPENILVVFFVTSVLLGASNCEILSCLWLQLQSRGSSNPIHEFYRLVVGVVASGLAVLLQYTIARKVSAVHWIWARLVVLAYGVLVVGSIKVVKWSGSFKNGKLWSRIRGKLPRLVWLTPVSKRGRKAKMPRIMSVISKPWTFPFANGEKEYDFKVSAVVWSRQTILALAKGLEVLGHTTTDTAGLETLVNEDQCMICWAIHAEESEIAVLSCNHGYHLDCISEWFEHQKSCPKWRKTFQFEMAPKTWGRRRGTEPITTS